jgi:UDP-N-acetylmuramate: L-alanyl-gamma-D-glutamyl-meso-diaminopimelate ligase
VGGVPLNFGISARLGAQRPGASDRPLFVIEADEYDTAFFDKRSKFVHYRPRTAVLNNLEFDHADIFDDLAAIERQFHHLARTVPPTGRVIVNDLEESLTRVLAQGCWSQRRGFGSAISDFTAHGEASDFEVQQRGRAVGRVRWSLSGQHNQLNALAAIAAAEHVGVDPAAACAALAQFQNVRRRMEVRGRVAATGRGHHGVRRFRAPPHGHPQHGGRPAAPAGRHWAGSAERILAVFEPRSNTMKLGAMKSQLPWALEQADLEFLPHRRAGLERRRPPWPRWALAPKPPAASTRSSSRCMPAAQAGRPCAVHEQRRLWRRSRQVAGGAARLTPWPSADSHHKAL